MTAQRRAENLQHTAVPVDVVSPADLLKNGVTTPETLGSIVPALSIAPAGGGRTNFFLRGVGNFTSNPLYDSAIAFNYDGVYVGRPGATAGFFYDLERIEVLKGPQGTLYGRNATGGAINVIPVKPKLGVYSGYITSSYGNYNAVTFEGAVNAPLGGQGAVRLSGNIARHDGYLSDGTSDQDIKAVRLQVLEDVTPALSIRASVDYASSGGLGAGGSYGYSYRYNAPTGQYVVTNSGLGPSIGLLDPMAQAFRATLRAGSAGRLLSDIGSPYQDNEAYGGNLEINYLTGFGTLTVIPAWRYSRQDNINDDFGFLAKVAEKDEQFSTEARFVGTRVGPIDYTLGGFYYYETNRGHFAVGEQSFANFQMVDQGTKSYAAFARVTGHITDSLRVVGGIRYTADRKRFNGTADSLVVVCTQQACPTAPLLPQVDYPSQLPPPIPAPGGVIPYIGTGAILARVPLITVNTQLATNKPTYRGALEFDLTPRSLLYGSIETGFRSGGFSLAAGYETYQPEYITAYTLGSKNRFLDNRLQLNLEGFYWKYSNQQLATIALDRAGRQGLFTQNIGNATMYGVDAEARYLVTPSTLINAQVQYLNTKYDSFTYQIPVGNAPPNTGCSAAVDAANPAFRDVDCSGKPAFNSPKLTINIGGDQTFHFADYKIVASVDAQYRSGRYIGFEYQPGQYVGSTWTANAQLSFAPSSDRWSIAAFVRNIGNDRYPVTADVFGVGSAVVYVTAAPRTYGVRASVKF